MCVKSFTVYILLVVWCCVKYCRLALSGTSEFYVFYTNFLVFFVWKIVNKSEMCKYKGNVFAQC